MNIYYIHGKYFVDNPRDHLNSHEQFDSMSNKISQQMYIFLNRKAVIILLFGEFLKHYGNSEITNNAKIHFKNSTLGKLVMSVHHILHRFATAHRHEFLLHYPLSQPSGITKKTLEIGVNMNSIKY